MSYKRRGGLGGYATCLTPITRVSGLKSVLQNGTVLPGTQTMSSWLEMSSNGSKGGEKALCLFGGLESPHLLFT